MVTKLISVFIKYLWNCRTLLHMHTKTCMCGALCDLFANPNFWGGVQKRGALMDKHSVLR